MATRPYVATKTCLLLSLTVYLWSPLGEPNSPPSPSPAPFFGGRRGSKKQELLGSLRCDTPDGGARIHTSPTFFPPLPKLLPPPAAGWLGWCGTPNTLLRSPWRTANCCLAYSAPITTNCCKMDESLYKVIIKYNDHACRWSVIHDDCRTRDE